MPENYCRMGTPDYASPLAEKHWRPDFFVYPTHIIFDLDFDIQEEKIEGRVTHHLTAKKDVESIEFNAVNHEIISIKTETGKDVEFENTGEKIIVNYSMNKDATAELIFHYAVVRPKAGLYFVNPDENYPDISQQVWTQGQDEDTQFYAPVMDNPSFKHTSEFIGTIPKDWTSLSNGKLISDDISNGKRRMHWKFDTKHSTYLVSFAAGGLFEHKEMVDDIEIRWYAEKGREEEAKNSYENTGDILKFFSEYTKYEYPFSYSYSQWSASRFIFGGMENTTATTQTDLTLRDDRANLDSTSDHLVAHEAAHQWFGDWITAKSWAHAWLHESFATYFDALYTEYSKGREEFVYQMRGNKKSYLAEDKGNYRRPIVTNIYEEPIDLFDRHLYPGGSWRVHMLRNILGDNSFRAVLAYYLDKHAQGLVETVDLIRAIEEVTGNNLDWFFDQWIYQAGYPKFKCKHSWDKKNNLAKLTIKQTQKIKQEDNISKEIFRISTEIAYTVSGKETRYSIDIDEKEHTFYFNLNKKPEMVRFDPDYTVLCTVDFDKSQELLLYQLQNDKEIIGKILAVEKLADKSNHKVLSVFQDELLDEGIFWGVREVIAKALGDIRGDQARDILLDAMSIEHPKARRAVINALGEFPEDEKVAGQIISKLEQGDKSYFVEGDLLTTVGKLKHKQSFDLITKYMDRPTFNDYAIIKGIDGLVELDDDRGLDVVLERSKYGQAELGRNSAIQAIGKMGRTRPDRERDCLDALEKYARDKLFRARISAIQGFKFLENTKGISTLKELIKREPDGRVKSNARNAIKQILKAKKKPKEIKSLRENLEKLESENRKLQDRINKIESQLDSSD